MPGLVFETFEVELQNTLYNLFDPIYAPEAHLYEVFHLNPAQGLDSLRDRIIAEIDRLKSSTGFPQPTKSDQLHEILTFRFIQGLSQERAAEVLGLSTRHLRRKQNEAVHALASRIWQTYQAEDGPEAPSQEEPEAPEIQEDVSWTELMISELEVLHKNSPAISAEAVETLRRVVELAAYLTESQRIQLIVEPAQADIKIPVHPAVLQQMLLNLIIHILRVGYQGQVRLSCCEGPASVAVCLELKSQPPINVGPARTLAAVLGAAFEAEMVGANYTIRLVFQKVRRVSVLVVDDNSQVVQLYQRFIANTRYDLTHVTSGVDLLVRLKEKPADILMIDILLPDIDGWDLLLQLRRNPATAHIPVIICSVLGNAEMARTLGAARYLPKPIDRKSLLSALDEISAGRGCPDPLAQTPGA